MTKKKSSQPKKKAQPPIKEQEENAKKQQESKNQEAKAEEKTEEKAEEKVEEKNCKETCDEIREDAKDEKELLKRQIEALNDKHLRLIAEYDNYRKRTLKEKMELAKNAGENIILALLPVVDDLDRALEHLSIAKDMEAIKDGITLIHNKFDAYLKQQGVSSIAPVNETFDSEIHEAVTKIPAPSEEMKGKIIDCIQKGYKLNDRVIRYPKVVVGE